MRIDSVKTAAAAALQVQDACNTSGILRSFVEAIDALRAAQENPNTHAITTMFLYKLADMNNFPIECSERASAQLTAAETACREIVAQ